MKKALTMNNKAIVSSKGQVVIPRAIRDAVGIHAGHELAFEASEEGLITITPARRTIKNFFGRCKQSQLPDYGVDDAIAKAVLDNDEQTKSPNQGDHDD